MKQPSWALSAPLSALYSPTSPWAKMRLPLSTGEACWPPFSSLASLYTLHAKCSGSIRGKRARGPVRAPTDFRFGGTALFQRAVAGSRSTFYSFGCFSKKRLVPKKEGALTEFNAEGASHSQQS